MFLVCFFNSIVHMSVLYFLILDILYCISHRKFNIL
jgi:hypothetical protein